MNNLKNTNKLMTRIANFEKVRTLRWYLKFITILTLLVGLTGVLIFSIYNLLATQQIFDIFDLFSEDMEIISSYWQDTLNTFWIELPKTEILILFIFIVLIVAIWLTTRKKRAIIDKRFSSAQEILQTHIIRKKNKEEK